MKKRLLFVVGIMLSFFIFCKDACSQVAFPEGIIAGSLNNISKRPSGYKLYVEQGILCERIRVASKNGQNWADFVFEADYRLPSLQQVEKFINQHKHLPGLPTQQEVNEEGIDLAQTQAVLLQKVEELTLYMIRQEKIIKEQQRKIKRMERALENNKK